MFDQWPVPYLTASCSSLRVVRPSVLPPQNCTTDASTRQSCSACITRLEHQTLSAAGLCLPVRTARVQGNLLASCNVRTPTLGEAKERWDLHKYMMVAPSVLLLLRVARPFSVPRRLISSLLLLLPPLSVQRAAPSLLVVGAQQASRSNGVLCYAETFTKPHRCRRRRLLWANVDLSSAPSSPAHFGHPSTSLLRGKCHCSPRVH